MQAMYSAVYLEKFALTLKPPGIRHAVSLLL
jgi:hypothetical protein